MLQQQTRTTPSITDLLRFTAADAAIINAWIRTSLSTMKLLLWSGHADTQNISITPLCLDEIFVHAAWERNRDHFRDGIPKFSPRLSYLKKRMQWIQRLLLPEEGLANDFSWCFTTTGGVAGSEDTSQGIAYLSTDIQQSVAGVQHKATKQESRIKDKTGAFRKQPQNIRNLIASVRQDHYFGQKGAPCVYIMSRWWALAPTCM